jgi:outer membrane receptor protein involved in Fe transport
LSLCGVALTVASQSFTASAEQAQETQAAGVGNAHASDLPTGLQASSRSDAAPPITVTGTRIPRSDLTAVSPVLMIKGDEFRLKGATNVEDLLNQLPQVNPSQGEFFGAGATGAATIDLRGLGAVRTLVLVNGHRLMPGDPRYPVADVNSIPTAIIQRVEVLTGGAAAVYGSDAVAGVVNFILDTKLDGLKLEGQIGAYQHDNRDEFARGLLDQRQLPYPTGSVVDGDRENLSVAFGRSFFEGLAHVAIYGGYRRIAAVTEDQRDYGACPITAKIVNQRPSSVLECGGPLVSYPGNYFDNLGNIYQVTSDRTFVPGVTRFNSSPWNLYQRPDTRFTAGGFADLQLSNQVHAYAEVMAMRDRSFWQIGPSGDFRNTQSINCDNPLLSTQQHSLICRNGNFVGQIPALDENGNIVAVLGSPTPFVDPVTGATYSRAWLVISRRNLEGGPIQDHLEHKSLRLLGGFKGELGRGVTYDASYLFGDVTLDRQYRNNLSISRLAKALDVIADPATGQPTCRSVVIARALGPSAPGADANCVPWDVFATGQVTAEATAYLTVPPSMRGSFRQQVANANATIDLDRWGIGSPWSKEGAAINVGAEYRIDHLEFEPDEFSQAGDIAGFGEQVFPIRGSIDAKELFAEARIPLVSDRLVRRLAFEGALRQSWYDNPRSRFSSNTYKLALDLTAVTGLRFRASQQRAIRAPNVLELLAPIELESFGRDPCAGIAPAASKEQCALTGVTPGQYGHVGKVDPTIGYNAIVGGNPGLQPETAVTRTVGVVLAPRQLPGFSATVDWWDIDLKGAISKIGAQAVVDSCVASGDPLFCDRIHRDPNGSLSLGNGYVDDRQANLGGLKVRGIDANPHYSLALGRMGAANLEFRASYVLRWIVDNGGLSTPYDCAGLFGAPCGMQPRWRHTARATWDAPHAISLSLEWRRVGRVRLAAAEPRFDLADEVSPGHTKVAAQDYFDVAAAVRLRQGLEFRAGVNNLLDRQPPLIVSNSAAGDGPFNGNTYPAWYDPLGRYIFASVAVLFKP